MSKELILAIDFNNVFFGSYYSEKLINSKGINVNAIKGFFFKLKMLKDNFNPDYIILASDISRSRTFRRALYKPYKANRKPTDEDVINQMRYASQLISLMGYPCINNELYEADDILGMLGKFATDNNMDIIIISSDKDLYQLLNDNTFIMSPRNSEIIDVNYLKEKYKLTPQQWIEQKILQGDSGDNIPGVPGIGEITAIRLLQQFDSIENIYKHLNCVKWQLKDKLIEFQKSFELIKTLVTIITDYTIINLTKEMLEPKEKFVDEVYSLLDELELPSLINVMTYSLLVDKVHIHQESA